MYCNGSVRIRSCMPTPVGSYAETAIRAWPDERMERCAYRCRRGCGAIRPFADASMKSGVHTPTIQHGRPAYSDDPAGHGGSTNSGQGRRSGRFVCNRSSGDGNVQAFRGSTNWSDWVAREESDTDLRPRRKQLEGQGACQPLLCDARLSLSRLDAAGRRGQKPSADGAPGGVGLARFRPRSGRSAWTPGHYATLGLTSS